MPGGWELTDEQWKLMEPVLRPARRTDNRGRPWHDTRAVLHGVFWLLGTGAHWSELPAIDDDTTPATDAFSNGSAKAS